MDNHETITEIISDMRNWDTHSWMNEDNHRFIVDLAERIESAMDTPMCTMSCRELGPLINQYIKEIKHLRAALKPVMECKPKFNIGDIVSRFPIWDQAKCTEAVMYAQKILNGIK